MLSSRIMLVLLSVAGPLYAPQWTPHSIPNGKTCLDFSDKTLTNKNIFKILLKCQNPVKIISLNLSNNPSLTILPDNLFTKFPNLTSLFLHNTGIAYLPPSFTVLTNLEIVSFESVTDTEYNKSEGSTNHYLITENEAWTRKALFGQQAIQLFIANSLTINNVYLHNIYLLSHDFKTHKITKCQYLDALRLLRHSFIRPTIDQIICAQNPMIKDQTLETKG